MAKKYRVGIIGHTRRGDYGHAVDEAIPKVEAVEVVAVADPDEKGLAEAQKRTGEKQLRQVSRHAREGEARHRRDLPAMG